MEQCEEKIKTEVQNGTDSDAAFSDISDEIILNLLDIKHTMRYLYEGKGSQKSILILLREAKQITQRQLTDRMGIQPGSASEVLSKLENAGLVVRTASKADRRTSNITLTEAGKRMADEAAKQRTTRHREMFSCLTDEERTQLLALLEKVNTDWDERYRREESNGYKGFHHDRHCRKKEDAEPCGNI